MKSYAGLVCNILEVRIKNLTITQRLKQAAPDREKLQPLLNLSDQQISYITNSPRGQGLLYMGARGTCPFYSQFPKGNSIYKCLTSDLKEIKAFEEQEKRDKAKRDKETRLNQ